jgi:HSP20 family molecular chaperone IbpA
MSSFLQRLKAKDVIPGAPEDKKQEKVALQTEKSPGNPSTDEQLPVDIYKIPGAIIIYAQLAGSTVDDFTVSIEGDGDIVTIKGQRNRPQGEHFQLPTAEGREKILEECSWGGFYRQIILPSEVDSEKTEAIMKEGVLMLLLPLKGQKENGIRIRVNKA